MRTLAVVGTIALLLAGTAMGQSTITYTLEIGGDNHVADWENPGAIVNTAFTNGSATPPLTPITASPITWDVVAACSGNDGSGNPAQGIANVVFNLELKDSLGNVVAAGWTSTMNDGDMAGMRRSLAGTPDPLEMAAWCLGWDVDMNEDGALDLAGPPAGTGRIFDPVSAGGPYMDRVQFPSITGFGGGHMAGGEGGYVAVGATTTTVPAGMLMGMGVGYSQFVLNQNCAGVGLALGSVAPQWNPFGLIGLGAEPLAEGQIDMTGLPSGTYTLVLTVPKDGQNNPMGQNVIKGDYQAAGTGGFAGKADAVVEDTVSFVWEGGSVTEVGPVAWASFKTHGASDLFISLDPASAVGVVETRNAGLTKVKVQFDAGLVAGGASANYFPGNVVISPALTVAESLETTAIANDTLVLAITGSTDLKCHKIDLSAAVAWKGSVLADAKDCLVRVQYGNVNADAFTNLTDVALVKAKNSSAPLVQGANVPFDTNLDGFTNLTDVALTKAKNSSQTTTVCP